MRTSSLLADPFSRLTLVLLTCCFLGMSTGAGAGVVCSEASAVTAGETDTFDTSGDPECWDGTPPAQVDDVGDMGVGDGALRMIADGAGAGGKLVTYNINQWTGDYSALGSEVMITMEANNIGANPVTLRIAIGDELTSNPPPATASFYVTSDAAAEPLAAASGWTTVTFTLSSTDMVAALDAPNSDSNTLADVLMAVAEFRILHSSAANHGVGVDFIDTTLLIDDIRITQLPVELQSFSVE